MRTNVQSSSVPTHSAFTFIDSQGWEIYVRRWASSDKQPKALVQIIHGVADHSGRYDRFAQYLNAAGYHVFAADHRGHGNTAKERNKFGIAGDNGWHALVHDQKQLSEIIRNEYPELPLFLFAHSVGSLVAQHYLQLWGHELRGAILSGSLGSLANLDDRLAMIESQPIENAERPSVVFSALLASFNRAFEPGDTWLDWLSRDPDEVRRYISDPLCRVTLCNQFAGDILRGARAVWSKDGESRIPRDLPLLIIAGTADPVGENNANIRALMGRYMEFGITQLQSKFYLNARHELLNELNREEVHRDIVAWLDSV